MEMIHSTIKLFPCPRNDLLKAILNFRAVINESK